MKKSINQINENIAENICKFFLDNRKKCNTYYEYAENPEIGNIYTDINKKMAINEYFSQVTLVILTANKYEKNVLHQYIYSKNRKKIKRIAISLFPRRESKEVTYAYYFKWGKYAVIHIEAQRTGSYTIGGSADIVRYVINNPYLYPTAMISLGICFGIDEQKNYAIGNTVISRKIYPYFVGAKINESGYFVNDDNVFKTSSELTAKIKGLLDKNVFLKRDNRMVVLGNYITGEAVVSSLKFRNILSGITTQDIIAGEMEGYGLYKECGGTQYSIPCLIIKSICDWGAMKNFDSKKIFENLGGLENPITRDEQKTLKDRIQAYAAAQAVQVLQIFIENGIFDDSLLIRLMSYIKEKHGSTIYVKAIKEKLQEFAIDYNYTISNEFVVQIISNLVKKKILNYEKSRNIMSYDFSDIEDECISINRGK